MGSKSAVVIENDAKDLLSALSILRSFGFERTASFDSSYKAQRYLEGCLASDPAVPDLIIVDLDLQHESGYELIRHRRVNAKLLKIPVVVWSVLGEDHEQICEVFKINSFVPKWKGAEGLENAIREILQSRIANELETSCGASGGASEVNTDA